MTIKGIRIETQEQWDAVPDVCRLMLPGGSRVTKYDGQLWPGPGTVVTHVAIPVGEADEARRLLWEYIDCGANRLRRIADLILPPPLADAAKAQATPPPTCAKVLAEAVKASNDQTVRGPEWWDRARAALDAEEARP